jgi:hypothetical protein
MVTHARIRVQIDNFFLVTGGMDAAADAGAAPERDPVTTPSAPCRGIHHCC